MPITSTGYDGSISETEWAIMAPRLGMPYWVADTDTLAATIIKDKDRTIELSPGPFGGVGVMDTLTAPEQISFEPVASGDRYDLVVANRNWEGQGGVTSFRVIKGGTKKAVPAFTRSPGALDDQLLHLVHLQAGRTTPVAVYDLRGFGLNSRVQILDAMALEGYKNWPGMQAQLGREEYTLQVDRTWVRTGLISAASPAYRMTLVKELTVKDSGLQGQLHGGGWAVSGDNTMGLKVLSTGEIQVTKPGTYTVSVNVSDYFSNNLPKAQRDKIVPGVVKFALLGVWASPSYDIPIGSDTGEGARYGWEYAFAWTGVLTAGTKLGIGIAQNNRKNHSRKFRLQTRIEMVA